MNRAEEHGEERLHRTFVEYLTINGQPMIAAAALEGCVSFVYGERGLCGLTIDLPPASYAFIAKDEALQKAATLALRSVADGHLHDMDGVLYDFEITFRMKLSEIDEDWRNIVREMILTFKGTNQALVSEIMAAKKGRPLLTYNELRYASKSEIKIAMELETRKALFFPLAVAVRADTGEPWKDHREADFLMCHDGVWGILEVSYHSDRYEKDSEKTVWFKRAGILCVEHRTAERCYEKPAEVVEEFLQILARHKR